MRIELKNISKKFKNLEIIHDFSVIIESGKKICIFGESGSGKTTLINIIGLIENLHLGKYLLMERRLYLIGRNVNYYQRKLALFSRILD